MRVFMIRRQCQGALYKTKFVIINIDGGEELALGLSHVPPKDLNRAQCGIGSPDPAK